MYQTLTSSDYKKMFGLDNDYKVEAVLSHGNYDLEKQISQIETSLKNIGINYVLKKMDGFLQNIVELKIKDKKYWFILVYGGVALSEYLHIACLFGSQKNIHIGSCGGLNPNINSLSFLIPNYSYGNESSTRLYDRKNTNNIHYSDKKLNMKIKAKIDNEVVWEGPIITCGAMLAETREDVEQWSKDGYFGVEMETSTVFSVSNYFKVPSSALVYIADNLIKGQIAGDKSHDSEKNARYKKEQKMYDVAVEVLLNN